ncbi:sensor histidine kinase [Seonamhaeicola marinus]|uniref:Signal transduction histidine kinase internal region domain-containing protein n=1 Tax=Seonamhaeicola marinus TaxID=1912246 RepID=A0A5D0HMX5_9FLAO|nr:histidine kinase [Seonamhaeicola marinus]TYA71699.1 hypothetical protein FUA24_19260 [Seonamhaeicola marinus]
MQNYLAKIISLGFTRELKIIKTNTRIGFQQPEEVLFSSSLINTGAAIAIVLTFFLLLVFLITKLITKRYKREAKLNYLLWVKYIFVFCLTVTPIIYVLKTFKAYEFLSVWFVLLMLALFSIHTYFLIPKFIQKKRWTIYGINLFALLIVCIVSQIKVVRAKIKLSSHFYGDSEGNIDSDVIVFIVGVSIFLVLFSLLFHYTNLLSKKRKGILYLFKSKLVNGEVLVNVIVVTSISVPFVMNIGQRTGIFFFILFIMATAIFYFQTFVLFPRYALKKKIPIYLLYNLIIVTVVLIVLFLFEGIQSNFNSKNINLVIATSSVFGVQKSMNIALALTSLWLIIPAGIYAVSRKKIISDIKLGYGLFRKKEAELNQLKSQLNPHFLFNSLNTVYAFALKEGGNRTAEYIAKLSNLMRFLIDDVNKDTIPIETEVNYIQDFIELQSTRSAEKHDINIQISIHKDFEYEITPMLLVPFVENAFKHGVNPNKPSELKLEIKAKNRQIDFIIENSIEDSFKPFYKDEGYGIGIKNIRKRLELIYPERHNLLITKTEQRFNVELKLYL